MACIFNYSSVVDEIHTSAIRDASQQWELVILWVFEDLKLRMCGGAGGKSREEMNKGKEHLARVKF